MAKCINHTHLHSNTRNYYDVRAKVVHSSITTVQQEKTKNILVQKKSKKKKREHNPSVTYFFLPISNVIAIKKDFIVKKELHKTISSPKIPLK